jgi:hypothetical protein
MALFGFDLFGRAPIVLQHRDGSGSGVRRGRSRAAPNSFTRSGTRLHSRRALSPFAGDASETSPCRRAGEAKRRTRSPKGDGGRTATPRRNRDLRRVGAMSARRIGSVRVPLGRRAASVGRWSVEVEAGDSGHRRGGQSNRTGSGVCRSVTDGVSAPEGVTPNAVAGVPQLGRQLPTPGRSSPHESVMTNSSFEVLLDASTHPRASSSRSVSVIH